MEEKRARMQALIEGVLVKLLPETNVYNVFLDEKTSLADKLYEIIISLNNSIKITPQTLTDSEKAQARANIGALPDTYTPPNQTAEQVGADPKGTADAAVSAHNTSDDAHGDLRLLISQLNDKINAFLDSDDTTLDELSELIQAIKANAGTIEQLTSGKINVTDIINNLTTNVTNKPLSAAQGVVLKGLIDALATTVSGKPDLSEAEIDTLTAAIQ